MNYININGNWQKLSDLIENFNIDTRYQLQNTGGCNVYFKIGEEDKGNNFILLKNFFCHYCQSGVEGGQNVYVKTSGTMSSKLSISILEE